MAVTLEVCVDDSAGLAAAVKGGADRIELCAALPLGGLTPSIGFMAEAAQCGLQVMAMIRPRAGGFVYSEAELTQMEVDIAAASAAGLAGVVIGASLPDGALDLPALARLCAAAEGMDLTLHRAFDLVPDPAEALEQALTLPFSRILTSGGKPRATESIPELAALIHQAAGRISIMPGSGISAETAPLFTPLGITEIHGSCSRCVAVSGRAVDLGFGPANERRTDAALVQALKQALR
ncbi:copper homeostasis protein CutC [Xinfangfangia sp. CPCC 101601]|uniref:PF03932 family protein CutC n=1 Tax=Pseudogemmobacter lacusdianii TaxID=3069608 RepID=A0ABU0VZB5_9RHOB|nr:copper homeostasis protein CutC [Xinfangfangia sp. CPCC 101601]MDQ2066535.1 copper homeostasis protein CutC [Xinfangfangia sp. CPCC 101601]